MTDRFDTALRSIDGWGADRGAAAVVGPTGALAIHGDRRAVVPWASVTKLVTAWVVLIAVDRGLVDLDEPAGPPGSTVRHLLAHASGLSFSGHSPISPPGRRRIYSNTGFDLLGALVAEREGRSFADVLGGWILAPLGMSATELRAKPSDGLAGPLDDLVLFAGELLRPVLVSRDRTRAARTVAFPGLSGVVPGFGNFDPCDWGLGLELRAAKTPHWMGERVSPETFGHFGRDGSFVWVDPVADAALVVATDRPFGPWALEVWPPLSNAVVDAMRG